MGIEPAKRRDMTFRVQGGLCIGVGWMLFEGGSRSGGCFGTFGATVPQNDSLKARGGPWAPPPLV